jgi:single-strand DNA-binding protein
MYSLNKVQIIGNCTRDPEVRQTPGGQFVANIGVATNRQWKDRESGEQKEQVEFHNVTVWGKLAEICGQYLKKGAKVYFEGRLQTRNWEDDKGTKHYRTDIVADNMIMLGGRGDSGGDFRGGVADRASESAGAASPVPEGEKIKVEDLPF